MGNKGVGLKMQGENSTLFDMDEFQNDDKELKKGHGNGSALSRIRDVDERLLKNLEGRVHRGEKLTAADLQELDGLRKRLLSQRVVETPEHVVTSKEAVAQRFGKTKRTIINWGHKGMPQLPNGYNLVDIGKWALKEGLIHDQSLVPGNEKGSVEIGDDGQDENGLTLSDYKLKIARLESDLKALKLQEAKGETVRWEDIIPEWATRIGEVSKGIEYLSNRLPPLVVGKTEDEIQLIISNEGWDIRDRFAKTGRFCPEIELVKCNECGSYYGAGVTDDETTHHI